MTSARRRRDSNGAWRSGATVSRLCRMRWRHCEGEVIAVPKEAVVAEVAEAGVVAEATATGAATTMALPL